MILSASQQWWFEQKTLNNTNLKPMWRAIIIEFISESLNYFEKNIVRFCSNFMLRTFTWLRSILESFNEILKYFDQRHLTEEIWDLWKLNLPAIKRISFSYPIFKILESSSDQILEMLHIGLHASWRHRVLPIWCRLWIGSSRVTETRKNSSKMEISRRNEKKARLFREILTQKV